MENNKPDMKVDEIPSSSDPIFGNNIAKNSPENNLEIDLNDTVDTLNDINTQELGNIENTNTLGNVDDIFASEPILAASPANTPRKKNKSVNTVNLLKIVALTLVLAIVALLAYLFLKDSSTPESNPTDNPQVVAPSGSTNTNQAKLDDADQPVKVEAQPITKDTDKTTDSTATTNAQNSNSSTDTKQNQKADQESTKDSNAQAKVAVSTTDIKVPEPNAILNAEIPQDEALVKEEIDRLEDQDKRLIEQEQLLDKRVQMMGELTSKKQEQIELLEKQIAQLEEQAKKNGK